MVYRRSTLNVLLGPEGKTRFLETSDDEQPDTARRNSGGFGLDNIAVCNLYKRTRPPKILQARPRLEKQHTSLTLAGHTVQNKGAIKSTADDLNSDETQESERVLRLKDVKSLRSAPPPLDTSLRLDKEASGYSPTFHRPALVSKVPETNQMSGNRVSDIFMKDFGLKSINADTFASYIHVSRRNTAAIEKQMEDQATRHIRACQAIGDVKRNSLAQRSYHGLKDTVSPTRRASAQSIHDGLPRGLVREHSVLRPDSNRSSDYIVHIRRPVGSISRTRNINAFNASRNALPEIKCRTVMLGSLDGL